MSVSDMSDVTHDVLKIPYRDLTEILNCVGDWEFLRGQNIFLTGGTGFIGKWLLASFAHANREFSLGAKMLVLSRNVEAFQAQFPELSAFSDIQWLQGDIKDFSLPAGYSASLAIHAATDVVAARPPAEIFDDCVVGTQRVLAEARRVGVRRLLLLSSGAVYGRTPSELERIPETWSGAPDPLLPSSSYGEGKRVSEFLCAADTKPSVFETIVARCFAFVGPHLPLDKHFAIGNFIKAASEGSKIEIKGDGTPVRSYLYAAELAAWLWMLLFRGENARAYNVGGAESLSIAELADLVVKTLQSNTEIHVAQRAQPGAYVQRYVPDVERIACELGLKPQVTLEEAILKTADWAQREKR